MTREDRIAEGRARLLAAIPECYGAPHTRALMAQVAVCSAAFISYLKGDELDVVSALKEAGVQT